MTFVLQPERKSFRITYPWLPASVWFTGFVVGISICNEAAPVMLSMMRGITLGSVSIVGLLVSVGIPFLISAVAVIYSSPALFLSVFLLKAISFLPFCVCVIRSYGAGGWLVQMLLMSHEILSLPIWYTFCLRCLRFGKLPGACECLGLCSLEILVLAFSRQVADPLICGLEIL